MTVQNSPGWTVPAGVAIRPVAVDPVDGEASMSAVLASEAVTLGVKAVPAALTMIRTSPSTAATIPVGVPSELSAVISAANAAARSDLL